MCPCLFPCFSNQWPGCPTLADLRTRRPKLTQNPGQRASANPGKGSWNLLGVPSALGVGQQNRGHSWLLEPDRKFDSSFWWWEGEQVLQVCVCTRTHMQAGTLCACTHVLCHRSQGLCSMSVCLRLPAWWVWMWGEGGPKCCECARGCARASGLGECTCDRPACCRV